MILIEEVREIPKDVLENLTEYSHADYISAGGAASNIILNSRLWAVRDEGVPLLCTGVRRRSLLSPASFWFLRCNQYGVLHVRRSIPFIRWLIDEQRGLTTLVEDGFTCGERFARFFGFMPTAVVEQHDDKTYRVYEAL